MTLPVVEQQRLQVMTFSFGCDSLPHDSKRHFSCDVDFPYRQRHHRDRPSRERNGSIPVQNSKNVYRYIRSGTTKPYDQYRNRPPFHDSQIHGYTFSWPYIPLVPRYLSGLQSIASLMSCRGCRQQYHVRYLWLCVCYHSHFWYW